jgi:hypothetical protein
VFEQLKRVLETDIFIKQAQASGIRAEAKRDKQILERKVSDEII